ncbi:MAG: hypothetical protein ABEJ86_04955 [Halococcoides sp.]
MERLTTCYFCGAGPQETLLDRPVVPEAIVSDPSAQRTITLCSDCRSKFDRIAEVIAEAASDDQRRLDAATDPLSILDSEEPLDTVDETLSASTTDAADGASTAEVTDTTTEPATTDTGRDRSTDGDDFIADTRPEADAAVDDPGAETVDETVDDPADDPAADIASETDDGRPIEDATDSGDATVHDDPKGTKVDPGDEPPTGDGRESAETGPTASDESPAAEPTADGGDPADAGTDDPTAGEPFDRTEYSNVVKLLQNREFPIELDALYELARGAYEIDEDTTTAIVGSLIDRGVIEERGGQLFRT